MVVEADIESNCIETTHRSNASASVPLESNNILDESNESGYKVEALPGDVTREVNSGGWQSASLTNSSVIRKIAGQHNYEKSQQSHEGIMSLRGDGDESKPRE